jgi:hypothetical protein
MTGVHEVSRKRLNCSSAWIKQMSDGSVVLQSFATDVVRKNPDGTYTRLWHSWSTLTNKHVHAWCGKTFRDIPFIDGSVEDRKPIYRRKGFDLNGDLDEYTPKEWKEMAKDFAESISCGQLYLFQRGYKYSTGLHKDLRVIYKRSPKYLELFNVLDACIKKKPIRGNTVMNTILMLYNYDFAKIWTEGGLCVKYPNLVANPAY